MKILFLTKGDHVDYQNDCLLIGLRELFGADVVDYNKQAHNYTTYSQEAASKLYGKGMTVTRVLPDIEVDRTDITSKIKNKYFDYIVYGHIWRFNSYLDKILEYYPPNRVIAVDCLLLTNKHNHYLGKKRRTVRQDSLSFQTRFVLHKIYTQTYAKILPNRNKACYRQANKV